MSRPVQAELGEGSAHPGRDHPTRYTSEQVCDLAGISYRQLDYWVRLRHLRPRQARYGSGTGRIWTTEEALKACAMARMVADGITLSKAGTLVVRGCYATLVEHPLPEGELDDPARTLAAATHAEEADDG